MTTHSHLSLRDTLFERITSGEWALGSRIPDEMKLAEEYGCSRTTVNRSLQSLADSGLLIRKRKGGTRVCDLPVRQAKIDIPIIREQIEANGNTYRHQVILKKKTPPPLSIRTRLRLTENDETLYMETIHLADQRPYAFEVRWINIKAVPKITEAPLDKISVNEWLVKSVPFSNGDVMFSAVMADDLVSNALETKLGAAIFQVDRTTWFENEFITTMKLYYNEGFQLYSNL